jgi:hypothetical protein
MTEHIRRDTGGGSAADSDTGATAEFCTGASADLSSAVFLGTGVVRAAEDAAAVVGALLLAGAGFSPDFGVSSLCFFFGVSV